VVEDISTEVAFCSNACRETQQRRPDLGGRSNPELIEGLEAPIRTGWQLCTRVAGSLVQWVGVPVGLGYSVFEYATDRLLADPESGASLAASFGFLLAVAAAAPATAVVLSRAHAADERGNPWPHVGPRYLPWLLTMLLFLAATILGTLAFLVPGIILGIRLFWADEFALVHGHGPVSALRESLHLTRGLTGRVFGFQFALGFAEYLVLIPMFVGLVAVEAMTDALALGLATNVVASVLLSCLFVITYASAHAAEVVYFYGLRALRAELPADEIHGDWVDRGLRVYRDSLQRGAAPSVEQACPLCGTRWNPADYRADAEPIFCSICRTELTRAG
jgi:hypothetical protein